jgi:hypothetical protein
MILTSLITCRELVVSCNQLSLKLYTGFDAESNKSETFAAGTFNRTKSQVQNVA